MTTQRSQSSRRRLRPPMIFVQSKEDVPVPAHASNTTRAEWPRGLAARMGVRRTAAALVSVALVAATGCGGSSKPAYCSDSSNLEESVQAVPGQVKSGDVSALKTQLTTIETDAQAVADSAKSDFPSETSAITSSVDTLKTAVDGLPSSPSAADLAPLALDAANVVSAVKDFSSATSSKCD
jgi:hypothetical protein